MKQLILVGCVNASTALTSLTWLAFPTLTVDLNHIFLFLAVVSSLLVLARAWRPGQRVSWLAYRCTSCAGNNRVSLVFLPSAAGYIGGFAWFALLLLPAIGLRKMTELAAQGRLQIGCKTRRNSSNLASQRRAARPGPIVSAFGISPKTARLLSESLQSRAVFGIANSEVAGSSRVDSAQRGRIPFRDFRWRSE